MKTTQRNQIIGMLMTAAMTAGVVTARATHDDLLKVLEENKAITAEQAAELKKKAPAYTVRPANKAVKDIQIRGRIHAQAGFVDAENDEGSDDFTTFELRRVRLGLRGTLLDSIRAQFEANLVPGSSLSMRSAYLEWRDYKPAYIKLGYDKPLTSMEENTSSSEILTVERSLINNTLSAPGPITGLSLSGELPILIYGVGVYTDRDNRNPGGSESDYMYNAMAGLKLDDLVGEGNKLLVRGSYVSSDDSEGKIGSKYDDVITVGAQLETGRFGLQGEYFMGDSDGEDTTGWYVMPSFYLTKKLQAVVRFEQAESDKSTGLKAASRYVRDVPLLAVRETLDEAGEVVSKFDPQGGDEYQSIYVGLNYYMLGHGHKLMLGVEQAELKNTKAGTLDSTSVTAAWRMLF